MTVEELKVWIQGNKDATELSLMHFGLTSLPAEIGQLTNLRSLDLDGNRLTSLPAEIGQLANLQALDLRNTGLTSLPAEIVQLANLQRLYLSNNGLTSLPAEIVQLTNLQELYLNDNGLTSLPAEIVQLKNLQELYLSNNGLTSLPAEIVQLTNLQTLYLNDNGLTSLPAEIVQLKNLQELYLSNNGLTSLPAEIVQLTNLRSLDLDGNRLTSLPAEIVQLANLQELYLSNNGLTSLPAEIVQLTNLQTLYLNDNGLTSLPAEIVQLKNLQELYLSNNGLTSLPAEIVQLTNLRSLDLDGNRLTSLPAEIVQLANLQELYLSNNGLTSLPAEIVQLTNLQRLYLSNNGLTSLPAEIVQLTNLQRLNLNNNGLTSLPAEIVQLTNLQKLDLRKNELRSLPAEVVQLKQLEYRVALESFVKGNPLESPPLEVVGKGAKAVAAYFQQRSDFTRIWEAKLLIVGEGNVGKTYLLNRLVHDRVDRKTISTEGIDIHVWRCGIAGTSNFRINFWDFGGQEIYHATHQFFLTKRSLYLLAWEARTDDDIVLFERWLKTIRSLSQESPVVLVQCKIDERKKLINQEGWKKRFPEIQEFIDVSAEKGDGIDELRELIFEQISALPHVGEQLPQKWVDIRRSLEALPDNFISYDTYRDICREHELDDEYVALLSEYYHDLGVFLHFKKNPVLKYTIFLKPDWATNAVYKVTDDPGVIENHGRFTLEQVAAIWANQNDFPASIHADLLELMKSFELCFEIEHKREYLIPGLMRENEPAFDWDESGNVHFRFEFGFMPSGVMPRLIVVMHDLIKEELCWKEGVLFNWEGAEALVLMLSSRQIEVSVRGAERRVLLAIIRRHMAYVLKPYSDLGMKEMVPCVCSDCTEGEELQYYDYQQLLKAKRKNKRTIECRNSFDDVPIDQLLGEIEKRPIELGDKEHKATSISEAVNASLKYNPVKIFLASSSELADERQAIKLLIAEENNRYYKQGVFLHLVIWEELEKSFEEGGVQERFNEAMLSCDIMLTMFHTRVGPFTREEFDLALTKNKAGENPRKIQAYYKTTPVNLDEVSTEGFEQVKALQEVIKKEMQMYMTFDTTDALLREFKRQLDLMVQDLVNSKPMKHEEE